MTAEAVATVPAFPIRDLRLVATTPDQLAVEQQKLIAWCHRKLADIGADIEDLETNLEHARKQKWKTSTITSALNRERAKLEYYFKIREALVAGYFIVPNFSAEVFAVRTTRSANGDANSTTLSYATPGIDPISPPPEAQGKGTYVNPQQEVERWVEDEENAKGEKVTRKFVEAVAMNFEIDFPFALAKPQVMEATQAAMALKIFDDIAVLPARERNADPMVVGIIRRKVGYTVKRCTFLVAWFLDAETL